MNTFLTGFAIGMGVIFFGPYNWLNDAYLQQQQEAVERGYMKQEIVFDANSGRSMVKHSWK